MAARFGYAKVDDVTTDEVITIVQLVAAANHAVRVTSIAVSFHGINNTHPPIDVYIARLTDAGTMSALTLVKADDSIADTLDTTALHTATVEPTTTDVLINVAVHPQTGVVYPVTPDTPIIIGAADRLGVIVDDKGNETTVDVTVCFEE